MKRDKIMNIICELGCNWNNIRDFRTMVLMCKEMGIKFIKMQMFKPEMVPKELRKMYIGKGRAKYFFNFAKSYGIELFFTPMYPGAVDILEEIGVNYYKIRFGDRYNFELLSKVYKTKKPVFISTDNSLIYNIERFIHLLCIPEYPARKEDYFADYVDDFEGISDHTKDLSLFKFAEASCSFDWFEMHVCLDKKISYEAKWSKELRKLREVL